MPHEGEREPDTESRTTNSFPVLGPSVCSNTDVLSFSVPLQSQVVIFMKHDIQHCEEVAWENTQRMIKFYQKDYKQTNALSETTLLAKRCLSIDT